MAKCIYDFLHDPVNITIIDHLAEAGLQMQISEDKAQPADGTRRKIGGDFGHFLTS